MAKAKKTDKKQEIKYSKYQKDIFDYIEHGQGHLVVEAAAGSGKTFTLIKCLELIPNDKRILLTAFNKDIVNELKKKAKEFPNVECKTLHGLGMLMVMKNVDEMSPVPEIFKYSSQFYSNPSAYTKINLFRLKKHDRKMYMDNVKKYVDFARYFLCQTPKDLDEIEKAYEIETVADEKEVAMKLLEWGKTNLKTMDYTDMIWLPNVLNLKPIGLQYDYIMVDECQDMNKAERELVLKCFKMGTRMVSVGDENQLIYQFSGSDKDSLNTLKNLPNTKCLPLSISYRCADSIVEYAQRIVPSIEKNDDHRAGNVLEDVPLEDVKDGDMVLCRTNAPLVDLYNRYLKLGKKSYIVGKDIGSNMKTIIESMNMTEVNWGNIEKDGLFIRLYDDLFETRNKIMAESNVSKEDAINSRQFQDKLDMINAIGAMANGINSVDELLGKIDVVFPKKVQKEGIKLSTIHKSKGLECENVYIACKSLMPSKNATTKWEKRQERNLMYVAYTRAKNKLGFLDEKEFNYNNQPNGTLDALEAAVNFVLKKSTKNNITKKTAPKIVKKAKKIDITVLDGNTISLSDKPRNNVCEFSDLLLGRKRRKK